MGIDSTYNRVPSPIDRNDSQLKALVAEVMRCLPYEPNDSQLKVLVAFAHFYLYGDMFTAFLLNGYAGTGKTSLTGAIVQALSQWGRKVVLLAPTGRAAKVFTEYSCHTAYTIHRKIFRQDGYLDSGFSVAENKHTDTLFVVDEASMISNHLADGNVFGTGRLLDDLIHYVYSGEGCRLVLLGDVAQLPPVGQTESPALSPATLKSYALKVYDIHLTQIARQAAQSGILQNATILRKVMQQGVLGAPKLQLHAYDDVEALTGEFLLETIGDCYARDGQNETIVVTRSNKRASLFNQGIRNAILYREEELTPDDMLLVSKNNYFWAQEYKEIDFIANGDVMRVVRVWGEEEHVYGLRFANVTVEFPDHNHLEMDAKIILDCLGSDRPGLAPEQAERLYMEVMNELTGDKRSRYRQLKQHPYFNALQVKYAYAVTCHKAQGGQWKNVLVDMGAIMPDAFGVADFYRWLYTAVTRARHRLYLINCPQVLLD